MNEEKTEGRSYSKESGLRRRGQGTSPDSKEEGPSAMRRQGASLIRAWHVLASLGLAEPCSKGEGLRTCASRVEGWMAWKRLSRVFRGRLAYASRLSPLDAQGLPKPSLILRTRETLVDSRMESRRSWLDSYAEEGTPGMIWPRWTDGTDGSAGTAGTLPVLSL